MLYVYIYLERERDRDRYTYIYLYMYMYIYIYVYIYIMYIIYVYYKCVCVYIYIYIYTLGLCVPEGLRVPVSRPATSGGVGGGGQRSRWRAQPYPFSRPRLRARGGRFREGLGDLEGLCVGSNGSERSLWGSNAAFLISLKTRSDKSMHRSQMCQMCLDRSILPKLVDTIRLFEATELLLL